MARRAPGPSCQAQYRERLGIGMTGLGARVADRWVRCYTRGLPTEIREDRRAEITCDVFEQLTSATGSARATNLAITSRALRGALSDLCWRIEEGRAMKNTAAPSRGVIASVWAAVTQAWFAPIAVLVGLFDVLFAVAVFTQDGSPMPGRVLGPIIVLAMAAAMFSGLWLRARAASGPAPAGHDAGARARIAIGLAALAVTATGAIVIGSAVGGGYLLVAVLLAVSSILGGVLVSRRGRPSSTPGAHTANPAGSGTTGEVLMVIGVLPALAMFWMIIPPLAGIAVITGIFSTAPTIRQPASA